MLQKALIPIIGSELFCSLPGIVCLQPVGKILCLSYTRADSTSSEQGGHWMKPFDHKKFVLYLRKIYLLKIGILYCLVLLNNALF